MAFKLTNFGTESGNPKSILGGISYYRYYNQNGDTLTTAGYFPYRLGLHVGDRIRVIPSVLSNTDELYYVSDDSDNTITVALLSGGAVLPDFYIEKTLTDGVLTNGGQLPDFSNVKVVKDGALYYAFYQNQLISGAVDLSSITEISGDYACGYTFYGCTGITSVDLSSLTTISGSNYAARCMFCYCTSLASVDLSSLTTISGDSRSMFQNCTSLTTVDISSLTTISGSCSGMFSYCSALSSISLPALNTVLGGCGLWFQNCTSLTSMTFPALTTIDYTSAFSGMFKNCTSLTSVSFPALTSTSFGSYKNQFTDLVSGVVGCTIHFPSNLDPANGSTVISSLNTYPLFGGTNTVLAFDLPETES